MKSLVPHGRHQAVRGHGAASSAEGPGRMPGPGAPADPWGSANATCPSRLSAPTRDPSEARSGRPGQTRLLRPATHEALPARPPGWRGKRPPRAEARCGAERGRAAGPLPWRPGCPPSGPAPARASRRGAARGPSPRLWLPARAPRSPRSARARLSAVFAFAFLPPSSRKMKVPVAVARARAAAVEARGEESSGGRRGACELRPLPAPGEVSAAPRRPPRGLRLADGRAGRREAP
ncbi:hypothetical protein GH733_009569 [Mirounga leonina]|nr:hypothetical protein GH733_009569 [Mirounga leonina]